MASATATATMMAAGFDNRASTASSSLQTPGSGTFPSEMLSPMAASPGFIKREDALKTPITPPSAYLDFLKNMSPAVMSPASATSTRFSFNDKSFDKAFQRPLENKVVLDAEHSSSSSSISPPTSQAPVSRSSSYESSHPTLSRNTSCESTSTEKTMASISSAAASTGAARPESPRLIIPPSPFAKPAPRSARTPRRLRIPQSPFSPALASAQSVPSPYTSTPLSAAPWSASSAPRENNMEHISAAGGKVHVRQVVTRTVTYCRTTPLDPAPRGKRRKIEVEDVSQSTLKAVSEEEEEEEEEGEPGLKKESVEEVSPPQQQQQQPEECFEEEAPPPKQERIDGEASSPPPARLNEMT